MHLAELMTAQALRSSVDLQPIDGPGGRVFPPTTDEQRHVVEELPNGERRVLIDSVASQANRQEAALVEARAQGVVDFADIYVDLAGTKAGIARLSATEMPHRLADAILRDSEIDRVPFGKSGLGQRILAATTADYSALLETSPTSLLYGCWFSRHKPPLRIQRVAVSEIWAENAVLGKTMGSRIDPLGIEALALYQAADGDWTANENEAAPGKGKPKPFSKRPSELGHGNIPPSIRDQGITAACVTLKWALSLAAIRRLHFAGSARDAAGQAYIVALGIAARVLDHEGGYSLRSRCDLLSAGPVTLEVIDHNGVGVKHAVRKETALQLLQEAEKGMRKAGLKLHEKVLAQPSQKLVGLIAANRRQQEVGSEAAAVEAAE